MHDKTVHPVGETLPEEQRVYLLGPLPLNLAASDGKLLGMSYRRAIDNTNLRTLCCLKH